MINRDKIDQILSSERFDAPKIAPDLLERMEAIMLTEKGIFYR
jgi:hypothetical protein